MENVTTWIFLLGIPSIQFFFGFIKKEQDCKKEHKFSSREKFDLYHNQSPQNTIIIIIINYYIIYIYMCVYVHFLNIVILLLIK